MGSVPADVRRVIATMTTGARARVPGLTDPAAVAARREDEVRQEAKVLEAEARFLRCRYYDSGAFEEEDVARTAALLDELAPAWVLAPSREDPHPTHRLTRLVLDEALVAHTRRTGRTVEVWTFEGAWYQHPTAAVNALVVYDEATEARKLDAVRCHASQLARVPFDAGAAALARLRAATFSESHLGGTEPGNLETLPPVEAYVRLRYGPSAD